MAATTVISFRGRAPSLLHSENDELYLHAKPALRLLAKRARGICLDWLYRELCDDCEDGATRFAAVIDGLGLADGGARKLETLVVPSLDAAWPSLEPVLRAASPSLRRLAAGVSCKTDTGRMAPVEQFWTGAAGLLANECAAFANKRVRLTLYGPLRSAENVFAGRVVDLAPGERRAKLIADVLYDRHPEPQKAVASLGPLLSKVLARVIDRRKRVVDRYYSESVALRPAVYLRYPSRGFSTAPEVSRSFMSSLPEAGQAQDEETLRCILGAADDSTAETVAGCAALIHAPFRTTRMVELVLETCAHRHAPPRVFLQIFGRVILQLRQSHAGLCQRFVESYARLRELSVEEARNLAVAVYLRNQEKEWDEFWDLFGPHDYRWLIERAGFGWCLTQRLERIPAIVLDQLRRGLRPCEADWRELARLLDDPPEAARAPCPEGMSEAKRGPEPDASDVVERRPEIARGWTKKAT